MDVWVGRVVVVVPRFNHFERHAYRILPNSALKRSYLSPRQKTTLRLNKGYNLNWQIPSGEETGVVMVKRGKCTFVEKAKNVQSALAGATGGREEKAGIFEGGGMVVLNGEDSLADMPAGNLLTDDVIIPVAM